MKRFRIGNDITINWQIRKSGSAVDVSTRKVQLFMTHPKGREEVKNFTKSGSTISFVFSGLDQKVLGKYTLTVDIREQSNQRFLIQDKCGAFELVGRSCAECEEPDETIYEVNL